MPTLDIERASKLLREGLREARLAAGITQEQAAAAIGTDRLNYLAREMGRTKISAVEYLVLCRLYGRDGGFLSAAVE